MAIYFVVVVWWIDCFLYSFFLGSRMVVFLDTLRSNIHWIIWGWIAQMSIWWIIKLTNWFMVIRIVSNQSKQSEIHLISRKRTDPCAKPRSATTGLHCPSTTFESSTELSIFSSQYFTNLAQPEPCLLWLPFFSLFYILILNLSGKIHNNFIWHLVPKFPAEKELRQLDRNLSSHIVSHMVQSALHFMPDR